MAHVLTYVIPAKAGIQEHHREDPMPHVTMTVNGQPASAEVEGRTLLVQFLREHPKLTGTHEGCDTTQCGAAPCTWTASR